MLFPNESATNQICLTQNTILIPYCNKQVIKFYLENISKKYGTVGRCDDAGTIIRSFICDLAVSTPDRK